MTGSVVALFGGVFCAFEAKAQGVGVFGAPLGEGDLEIGVSTQISPRRPLILIVLALTYLTEV
jgi:hypothetical protein